MGRRVSSPTPTNEYRLAVRRIICDACRDPLYVAHQAQRTIRRLNGVWRLTLVFHRCLNHHCRRYRKLCRPEEEGTWALPHGEFGFDVIALIGQLRYGQHRSIPEIHQDLRGRGLEIAERTVTNLLARYDELLALRLTDAASLQERLIEQGRVVLGLDGLKPDVGHEVLWVVRDCLSGDVLVARTLLSEAEKELSDLLQEVQALLPVPITGVISDGQHSIRNAVHSILPDVPHQLCQYHYLREAVKPLYEADRHAKKELKKAVREIRPIERTQRGFSENKKSRHLNTWRNSLLKRPPLLRAIVLQFVVPSRMMDIPRYVLLVCVSQIGSVPLLPPSNESCKKREFPRACSFSSNGFRSACNKA
jgi:hypothetical protein